MTLLQRTKESDSFDALFSGATNVLEPSGKSTLDIVHVDECEGLPHMPPKEVCRNKEFLRGVGDM